MANVWLNVLFNVMYVLFSLVSLGLVGPFLGMLFGTVERVYDKPEAKFTSDYAIDFLYYNITRIIEAYGPNQALTFICLLIATAFLMRNLCRYFALFFMSPVRHGVIYDLRNAVYQKIIHMPLSFFSTNRKGDLISRMTSDINGIQTSIMKSLSMVVRDPLTIITYLFALVVMSPKLTGIVAILFPISAIIIGKIGKSLKRSSKKGQSKMGDLLSHLEEIFGGLRIIKGFVAEKQMEGKFDTINNEYRGIAIKMLRKKDLSSPISEFLSTIVMVIVMWVGGNLVLDGGEMEPQTFITYVIIFSQIISPAKAVTSAYYEIQKGNASAERVLEILDSENHIVDKPDAKAIKKFEKEIKIENVSFAYKKNKTVLNNINVTLTKGKTIAFVGASGSGKSTMADLVGRFYDVTSGSISIDGVDVRDYKMQDVRGLLGIVSQESVLFNDSVMNNITLGSKVVDKDRVISAAKIANAHEFIVNIDGGYDAKVGERGSSLSGGQKQRLSIARAIYKDPPILILDEATSALDTESEKLVQVAIENLMKNRTSLVIAHRLSTIQNADEILVLDAGEVVERGNHKDLFEAAGVYRKLCDLQSFD